MLYYCVVCDAVVVQWYKLAIVNLTVVGLIASVRNKIFYISIFLVLLTRLSTVLSFAGRKCLNNEEYGIS